MKLLSILIAACLGLSCTTSKPAQTTTDEPLTTPDPLDAFVANLETEPEALVFVHRLEIDGKAPLEIVVEERCLPDTCTFGSAPEYLGEQPPVTRFRAFDVSDIQDPVELQTQPIIASYHATLSSAQIIEGGPRELLMRTDSSVQEGGQIYVTPIIFELAEGTWQARRDIDKCVHVGYRRGKFYYAVDADADGAIDWVSLSTRALEPGSLERLSMVEICSLEKSGEFISLREDWFEEEFDQGTFQDAYIATLNQPSPDPTELAIMLVLLQERGMTPATLEGVAELLIPAYEHVATLGPPLSAVEEMISTTRGDLGLTEVCSNPDFDRECFQKKAFRMSVETPEHTLVTQALYLRALRWPDEQAIGAWAAERAMSTRSADEARAMTQLAWSTLPHHRATEWASAVAANQIEVFVESPLPALDQVDPVEQVEPAEMAKALFGSRPPQPGQPPMRAHPAPQRSLAIIEALMQFEDPLPTPNAVWPTESIVPHDKLAWDATTAFQPLYEAARNDPARLAALLENPTLVAGLTPHLLEHDWTTAAPSVADALIQHTPLFSDYRGDDADGDFEQMLETAATRASPMTLVPLMDNCEGPDSSSVDSLDCATLFGRTLAHFTAIEKAGLIDERFVVTLAQKWAFLERVPRFEWSATLRTAGLADKLSYYLGRPEMYARLSGFRFKEGAVDIATESVLLFEDPQQQARVLTGACTVAARARATPEQVATLNERAAELLTRPDSPIEVIREVLTALQQLPTISNEVAAALKDVKKEVEDPRIIDTIDTLLSKAR